MTHARPILPLAAALALSGCISFGPKPPPQLIRLTAAEGAPADQGRPIDPGNAVTVMIPSAPGDVQVQRVPVRSGAAALTYLKGALYADAPPKLFRDMLLDTIRARTGRTTLEGRDYRFAGGARLSGRIDRLSVDADARRVDMVYDAVFQRPAPGGAGTPPPPLTRRFESHVPVAAVDAATVSPALAQAANDVATQVADWIGR